MYQLKASGAIKHNIVTYNITFNANAKAGSQSYVQLGDVSRHVTSNLMWLQTTGWDYFKSPVSLSYFMADGNLMYPFVEFNTTAIFDPQVDYMYVN